MTYLHHLEPSPYSSEWTGIIAPHQMMKKDTYAFLLYKYADHWAFNHWQTAKLNEGLLNGTEICLDHHYLQMSREYPNHMSEMYATFSTKALDTEPTTILQLMGEDPDCPDAHIYWDPIAEHTAWLCPYGTDMGLGGAEQLYLKLTLTNSHP